jgi:hypothetical protein
MVTTSLSNPFALGARRAVAGICLVVMMGGCSSGDEAAQKTTVIAKQPSHRVEQIRPETVIRFPDGTIACMNRDSLGNLMEHAINGEKTKMNAMGAENGGDCIAIPPNKRMRVISTDYPDQDAPFGLLEVVGEKNQSAVGAWVFSAGAKTAN